MNQMSSVSAATRQRKRLDRVRRWDALCYRATRKLALGLAALSPAKRRAKTQWLTREGVEFLRAVGIGKGDTVVDLGCGAGAYSIPAALLIGNEGLVVSVDVRAPALKRMARHAAALGVGNIRTAQNLAEMAFLLKGRSCRAVLLYDVLHFMDTGARKALYGAFRKQLAPDGFLSVFPNHLKGDSPSRFFRDMTIDEVIMEIESSGFLLQERRDVDLWHNPDRVRGTVLTLRISEPSGTMAKPLCRDVATA